MDRGEDGKAKSEEDYFEAYSMAGAARPAFEQFVDSANRWRVSGSMASVSGGAEFWHGPL